MKVYVITNTHRLIAIYKNKEDAERAVKKIEDAHVIDKNNLFCVEWNTNESDARVDGFIKYGS